MKKYPKLPPLQKADRCALICAMLVASSIAHPDAACAGPQPDGVIINETFNTVELFNDQTNLTVSVSIFGDNLVFEDDGTTDSLYRRFNYRRDVREMCLSADTVVIRSPLLLPQTHVTIYARELRFEGQGFILTTPFRRRSTPLPATWADNLFAGRNGDPGHDAGGVDVFVTRFLSDAVTSRRFIVNGGDGGPPGQGRNGVNENQVPFGTADWTKLMARASNSICGITEAGHVVIHRERSVNGRVTSRCGTAVPARGEPAVPSGVPGPGGRGGILRSSVSIGQYADVAGGRPGDKGGDYIGGILSDRPFVYEFITTLVVNGREITETSEEEAVKERGWSFNAPDGVAGSSGTFLLVTNTEPRLALSINFASETVRISWPSLLAGFGVQRSSSLEPSGWVDLRYPYSETGATRFIELSFQEGHYFYRLAKVPATSASQPVTTTRATNAVSSHP